MRHLSVIALIFSSAPAFGAFNHCRPITVPAKNVHNSDQAGFPLLYVGGFYLATAANGGGVLNANGYDIVPYADSSCSTTLLPFERAKWSATTGAGEFWIKIPTLSHTTDTTVYLGYGNASITTDQQTPHTTWDSNFNDVQHFPDGSSLSTADSTGNTTFTSSGTPSAGMGIADGGMALNNGGLNGVPQTNALSATSSQVAATGSKTFEAWIRQAIPQPVAGDYTGMLSYGKSANVIYSLSLINDGSNNSTLPRFEVQNSTGSYQNVTLPLPILRNQAWHQIVGVIKPSNIYIYVDGVQYSAAYTGVPATGDGTFSLLVGRDAYTTAGVRFFNGTMDEVRVSNIARSADWIATEYASINDPLSFYFVGLDPVNSSNITNVQTSATNAQAIVQFTYTSDPSSCRVQVADNISFSPVVNDTNTSLFAGSDLVNRDSANIITGNTARIVIGKRYKAAYATDGKRYSRALHQNSPHYYQISCNSGADTYDGSFRTSTIAMGNTHLDGIPGDTASPGDPAWPSLLATQRCNTDDVSCSIARRDSKYVDPQTGLLMRHLILPNDSTITQDKTIRAGLATGTGWTIPGDWTTGAADNATITASTNPISIGVFQGAAGIPCCGDVYNNPHYNAPVMMQFTITANLGNVACDGTNPSDDCKLSACVTSTWIACDPNAQVYTQTISATPKTYKFGSGQQFDVMQKAGAPIWPEWKVNSRGTNVSCDGSDLVTVLWDPNGASAPTEVVVPGAYVFIAGVGNVQVTSSVSALQFHIATTCTSGGPYFMGGSSFGVMMWKTTSSADTLTLTNPFETDIAGSDDNPQYNNGFYGAPFAATLSNGDPAGLLQLKQGTYSIDLFNGKVGAFRPKQPNTDPFSGVDQDSQYDNEKNLWVMNPDRSLSKYTYTGDYSTPTFTTSNNNPLWEWNMGSNIPTCGGSITTNCQSASTTVTQPGKTLDVLLHDFDSSYSLTPFADWRFVGVELGVLYFDIRWSTCAPGSCSAPGQNYWGWAGIFNPAACDNTGSVVDSGGTCQASDPFGPGCVGSSSTPVPGCFVAARAVWKSPRWYLQKGPGQILRPGWSGQQGTINLFGAGGGPAVAGKNDGTFSTLTCPTNPYSLTNCVQFAVDGDPYDFSTGTSSRGILGSYAVGDYGMINTSFPGGPLFFNTNFPLLQVVTISGTTLTMGCVNGPSQCPTDANGQLLWMYSGWPGFYPWGMRVFGMHFNNYWNYVADPHGTNTTGNTVIWDYSSENVHSATANSIFSNGGSGSTWCSANQSCYNNANYQAATDAAMAASMMTITYNNITGLVPLSSYFSGHQGFNGECGNDSCQTHPDYSKLGSDPVSYFDVDYRPYVGIAGLPATSDIASVSGTLYKIANISGTLHPKIFDTGVTSGRHVFTSLSGPSSSISDTSTDYYKFCQAFKVNECRSGSSIGDFYVNVPFLVTYIAPAAANSACYNAGGIATTLSDNFAINDLCIYDSGMETQAVTRYNTNTFDMKGWSEQSLGHLLAVGRADIFNSIHPVSNITSADYPQWYWWTSNFWGGDGAFMTMLLEAPPINIDPVNRTEFQPVKLDIKPISGADGAAVEFWYSEYSNHCSPNRNDPCLATSSTIDSNTPFTWESESTFSPLSCASSCTIAVPALPEHVLYERIRYYSGSTLIGEGPAQVIPVR